MLQNPRYPWRFLLRVLGFSLPLAAIGVFGAGMASVVSVGMIGFSISSAAVAWADDSPGDWVTWLAGLVDQNQQKLPTS